MTLYQQTLHGVRRKQIVWRKSELFPLFEAVSGFTRSAASDVTTEKIGFLCSNVFAETF